MSLKFFFFKSPQPSVLYIYFGSFPHRNPSEDLKKTNQTVYSDLFYEMSLYANNIELIRVVLMKQKNNKKETWDLST